MCLGESAPEAAFADEKLQQQCKLPNMQLGLDYDLSKWTRKAEPKIWTKLVQNNILTRWGHNSDIDDSKMVIKISTE